MKHISEIISQMGYLENPSARRIISSKLQTLDNPSNKYNLSLQQRISEDLGIYMADERGGSDTGSELQTNH